MAGVRHVLRLDDDLSDFYAKAALDHDLAWAATGAGRMLQGPSVFEDVVKTRLHHELRVERDACGW